MRSKYMAVVVVVVVAIGLQACNSSSPTWALELAKPRANVAFGDGDGLSVRVNVRGA